MATFKKTLVYVLVIIYGFVFAEYFIRIFKPQALIPRYVTGSEFGIRANLPNSSYRHWTPEINVQMDINSAGMRSNREYDKEKPSGVCRIGLFGDSFFMSYEVSYEDSLAYQIEKYIDENSPHKCEVLNFAVSGFGTAESLLQYKHFARDYDLDIAILEWHFTDVQDNLRSSLFVLENGELVRRNEEYLPGISIRDKLMSYRAYRWAIEYSHLYSAVRSEVALKVKDLLVQVRQFRSAKPRAENKIENKITKVTERHETEQKNLISLDGELIEAFIDAAASDEVSTLLLDVPSRTFDGDIKSSLTELVWQPRSDITIVSPVKPLEKLNEQGVLLYFEQGHKHFTPIGYQVLAHEAAKQIISDISDDKFDVLSTPNELAY